MDSKKIQVGAIYHTSVGVGFGAVEVLKVYTDEHGREVCDVALCSREWWDAYKDGSKVGYCTLLATNLLEVEDKQTEMLVQAVKEHAKKNYEQDGWDFVIECYDNADIIRDMNGATTVEDAIEAVGSICRIHNETRQWMSEDF